MAKISKSIKNDALMGMSGAFYDKYGQEGLLGVVIRIGLNKRQNFNQISLM